MGKGSSGSLCSVSVALFEHCLQRMLSRRIGKSRVRCRRRPTRLLRAAQGDLTNPAYFDFISFAQLGTVSAALDRPRSVFQARSACNQTEDGSSKRGK